MRSLRRLCRRVWRWLTSADLHERLAGHHLRLLRLEQWHADWLTRKPPLPDSPAAGIKVKATMTGVYGGIYREYGDRFLIRDKSELGSWMEIIK